MATPRITAAGPRQAIGAYRSANSTQKRPTAIASGTNETSSVYTVAITSSAMRSSKTTKRQQADAQSRAAGSDQREHAEREGGVGRHGGSPAVRPVAAGVERQVDQDRQRHAPDRCAQRDRDPPPLAQLPHVELALGLEPEDQEEERHQALVHPVPQVLGDPGVPEADRELRRPDRLVRVRPRRVRPQERGERRAQQDRGAAGLGAEEVPDRGGEVPRPRRAAGGRRGGYVTARSARRCRPHEPRRRRGRARTRSCEDPTPPSVSRDGGHAA